MTAFLKGLESSYVLELGIGCSSYQLFSTIRGVCLFTVCQFMNKNDEHDACFYKWVYAYMTMQCKAFAF